MGIDVRPIDTADEDEVRRYWQTGLDAVSERRYQTYIPWQAAKTYIASPRPDGVELHLAAWDGDTMVGTGTGSASTVDNPHLAYVEVAVPPQRRREGIGSSLLEHLESWAREQGCTTLTSEVYAPVGSDNAGTLFAGHHRFTVDIEDGVKVADLQETRGAWDAIAAEVAPHHADYRFVTSWAPLPDEMVEGYCAVDNRFYELAPSGELEREAETLDPERLRAREERAARAGRVDLITMAFDVEDRAVALTELMLNTTVAHRVLQGGTIVLPEHRGHRLGLALKVANQRALMERFPEAEWVLTANADVNAAMNAINDRLGFRVVERCVEVVKSLR